MTVLGVIPAAGSAARLQPLAGSKEVVQVGGRAVMDYLVDRMRAGGADEIVVVTRRDKQDVVDHALELRLRVVYGRPGTVAESLLLGLENADSGARALLGFPDTIWEPEDGFVRLVAALEGADVALGVFESDEPERSDVVVLAGDRAVGVDVKPVSPRSSLVWGCAAAPVSALAALERHAEPGDLFDELARSGRVRAVRFPGRMIDVGTPEALAHARRLLGS